ncbi:MAG: glycosyltransferase family 4 protein [Hyphomonas sp.]
MPAFRTALRLAQRVWQALPVPAGVRQFVGGFSWKLVEQVSFLFSRRSRHWTPGPLHVAGFFSESHGIAASAIRCASALEALGYEVERIDLGKPSALGLIEAPASERTATGTYIIHANAPEFAIALARLGLTEGAPARVIGYWAWELPEAPQAWISRSRLCHEIWVPSEYVANAFRSAHCPVRVVPHPLVDASATAAADCPLTLPDTAFVALCMLDMRSSFARKNPLGAIAAFRQAFPDDPDVRLVIKTQHADQYADSTRLLREAATGDPRLILVDGVWPRSSVDALIDRADVYVSLHRTEGFGLAIAEMMQRGKPVLATAWSGNLDFMDAGFFGSIPAGLEPVGDPDNIYVGQVWAAPSIETAADRLAALRSDPGLSHRVGEEGRRIVLSRLGLAAYRARVEPALGPVSRSG